MPADACRPRTTEALPRIVHHPGRVESTQEPTPSIAACIFLLWPPWPSSSPHYLAPPPGPPSHSTRRAQIPASRAQLQNQSIPFLPDGPAGDWSFPCSAPPRPPCKIHHAEASSCLTHCSGGCTSALCTLLLTSRPSRTGHRRRAEFSSPPPSNCATPSTHYYFRPASTSIDPAPSISTSR